MDFFYSSSLLVSLIAGGAGVLLGVLVPARNGSNSKLIRAALLVLALAALSLATSVSVHKRWGHGPASPEPMGVAQFVGEHSAFLVAGAIILVGLVVLWHKRRRTLTGK